MGNPTGESYVSEYWPGTNIVKSKNNCFALWREPQEWSPNWGKVNQNANISSNSTKTVDAKREQGTTKSTFYGAVTVDLQFKPHGGAFAKAKASK